MLIHLPPSSIVTTRIFVVSLVGNIKPQPSLSTGVGMQNHSNHTVFELSVINLGQRPLRHSGEKLEEKQQTVPGLAKFGPKFPNKTLGVLRLMVFLCCGYLVASFPPPPTEKKLGQSSAKISIQPFAWGLSTRVTRSSHCLLRKLVGFSSY